MTDEPENLTLTYLRRLDAKMDQVIDHVQDLKRRMTSLEMSVARVHLDMAGQSARMDGIETRLERIERRLDLVGAP